MATLLASRPAGSGRGQYDELNVESYNSVDDNEGRFANLVPDFLKDLADKAGSRDGQASKRRGPKPDSKPALTRRQELNRQAQRTHRERKELYIKALEDEVLRLKELFTKITLEKDELATENHTLKTALTQQQSQRSTSLDSSYKPFTTSVNSYASTGASPASGSTFFQREATQATSISHDSAPILSPAYSGHTPYSELQAASPQRNPAVDYDQAGIDFVLTLEKPCMDHIPWLVKEAATVPTASHCGHALMASCPPMSEYRTPDLPLEVFMPISPPSTQNPASANDNAAVVSSDHAIIEASQQQHHHEMRTWAVSKGDLTTLLALSKQLDLSGEVTPIMAWGMVLDHPQLEELDCGDFSRITEELISKIRCYGFGAVMEEFEVRDAIGAVVASRGDHTMGEL